MKKTLASLILGACAFVSLNVSALPLLNGTFAASGLGSASYVGTNLNSASVLNISPLFVTTGLNATYFSNPNDLLSAMSVGDMGTIATSIVITGFTPVTNFLKWGSTTTPANRFSFDLNTLTRNISASGAMDLYGTGTYTDAAGAYASGAAAFRLTAQEIGGSTSYSFSWGSPAFENPVPLPGVLSLMGVGLMGLGAARRRNRA